MSFRCGEVQRSKVYRHKSHSSLIGSLIYRARGYRYFTNVCNDSRTEPRGQVLSGSESIEYRWTKTRFPIFSYNEEISLLILLRLISKCVLADNIINSYRIMLMSNKCNINKLYLVPSLCHIRSHLIRKLWKARRIFY